MSQSRRADDTTGGRAGQGGALGRRRRRLSDEETERRMLDTAADAVNESGLTVSLDHISFEDVIREAGVSRSTAYRRWPYKDLFFSDLLTELAKAATPAAVSSEETALPAIRQIVLEHLDWLATPELRRKLVLELIRRGALLEFETMLRSTEWRTYLALHATFLGVDDDVLRARLQANLAASERDFVERIAASWGRIAAVLGFRLRPDLGASFETFATLISADMRGLVLMALANPDIGTRLVRARPFGAGDAAEWSLPALALAGMADAFLEPDRDVTWDDARMADLRRLLDADGEENRAPTSR